VISRIVNSKVLESRATKAGNLPAMLSCLLVSAWPQKSLTTMSLKLCREMERNTCKEKNQVEPHFQYGRHFLVLSKIGIPKYHSVSRSSQEILGRKNQPWVVGLMAHQSSKHIYIHANIKMYRYIYTYSYLYMCAFLCIYIYTWLKICTITLYR
jgi:hypothetical protein